MVIMTELDGLLLETRSTSVGRVENEEVEGEGDEEVRRGKEG